MQISGFFTLRSGILVCNAQFLKKIKKETCIIPGSMYITHIIREMVVVAQLVRAPGCGPGGRGFEPRLPPH